MSANWLILIAIGAAVIISFLSLIRWLYSKGLERRIDERVNAILSKTQTNG
jgi:hypothetical protein